MQHDHTPDHSTALILGLTGGYGGAMAHEMSKKGWTLRALVRDASRARRTVPASLQARVELIEGDALDSNALREAARGVDVIVFGINVPYGEWDKVMMPITEQVIEVAVELGATIAFPGNVYPFAPSDSIAHDTLMAPQSSKGELRMRMEQALAEGATHGARVVTLRGGDFFGANSPNSWMAHILKKARGGGPLTMAKHEQVRHTWAYLPDFAKAHVALLDKRAHLPAVDTFHFRGHVLTEAQLVEALREALGDETRRVDHLPWWFIRLGGLFLSDWRGLAEMRYLWEEEVLMTQQHLEATIDDVPHTPLAEALRHELEGEEALTSTHTPATSRPRQAS